MDRSRLARTVGTALCAAAILLASGCSRTMQASARERLHGAPLSEDEVVALATSPAEQVQLGPEARLRGLGFAMDAAAGERLAGRGVSATQVSKLEEIAADADPFGRSPRDRNTPLIVVGVVGVAAAIGGIVWLIAEVIDDDDSTFVTHHGHTTIIIDDP